MRFLAVSDIHGNLEGLRWLRTRERNTFDFLLVPGDICGLGSSGDVDQVFDILSSFECPILYVYGNADHELSYFRCFGELCHHLHLRSMLFGEFTIVGFSGCSANWGRNPIAMALAAQVEHDFRHVTAAYEEMDRAVNEARAEVQRVHEAGLEKIAAKAKDRRRREYLAKVRGLEEKRDRLLWRASAPLTQIEESSEYAEYTEARWRSWKEASTQNRQALVDAIKTSDAPPEKTIVVTHERLFRMHEEVSGILLYVSGHNHKFKNTLYRGSRFVTVGALHQPICVVPEADEDEGWHNVHFINEGNYAVIELRGSELDVACISIDPSFAGWRRIRDVYHGVAEVAAAAEP